ncbi:MAG: PPOX class probable F420-dependent enzyme [Candidatus Azotimanducaceae bacterium]|jgi:PPOX class probable F420-dependent enzyme
MTELIFDPAKEPYVNLITYRKNGAEVRTPVWIAEYNSHYYVFSESKAGKVKRIRNNGEIKIAACDVRGKVKSEWIQGQASITTDENEIKSMYRAFDKKYTWQTRSLNFIARLSGRIKKRAILKITI